MRNAIFFDLSPREAIYFQVEVIQDDGQKGYTDISQEQYFGDGPMSLSSSEALELGIDISNLRESPLQPAITFYTPPEEPTVSPAIIFLESEYAVDNQSLNDSGICAMPQPDAPALKTLPSEPLSPPQIHTTAPEDRKNTLRQKQRLKKVRRPLPLLRYLNF